jgi:hypothetical protein
MRVADAGVLKSEIETPSEYEEASTVADNFMLAMPGIGFKLSFSSAKLGRGTGSRSARVSMRCCSSR